MKRLSNEEISNLAVQIVKDEVASYKDAHFFVTDKVAFSMRELVKKLRKNFWGVYDKPNDPVTGKRKFWAPYTQLVVNAVVRNSDMDTKDGRFRATSRKGINTAKKLRGFFRDWAHHNFWGETVNDTNLGLGIDGTQVWKTIVYKVNGKKHLKIYNVDILNLFLDPTSPSIQEAYRVTERSLMTPSAMRKMDWMNLDNLKTKNTLHRIDSDALHTFKGGEYVDVYEMWGAIPEYLITGRRMKKGNKEVEGRIVVSGIETGDVRLHKVERNTQKDRYGNIIKPYEDVRFIKIPGRWYGLGPAEMVLYIQEYINQILNNRLKKNTAAALGLFKVKDNVGINQKVLSGLVSQGVIKVKNMDDIANFPIEEAGAGSYRDEEIMKQWGFEITATHDVARGQSPQASASATAVAIENNNAQTGATMNRETMGLFWQRWFNRHFLPHVAEMIRDQGFARIYADFDDISADRERVIAQLAMEELDRMYNEQGIVPSEQEVQIVLEKAARQLQEEGDLLVEVNEKLITEGTEAYFSPTNEDIDASLAVQNLIQMMQIVPDAQKDMAAEAMDLMGLNVPPSLLNSNAQAVGSARAQLNQDPTQLLAEANTNQNGPSTRPGGITTQRGTPVPSA